MSNSLGAAPCKYNPLFAQLIELLLLFLVCSTISQAIIRTSQPVLVRALKQSRSKALRVMVGVTGSEPHSEAECGARCLAGGGGRGHDPAQDSG